LREKNNAMSKLHRERFEQVRSESCLFLLPKRLTDMRQNLWTHSSLTPPTLSHPLSSSSSLPLSLALLSHQALTFHRCMSQH
jgi:hypothetical protein